MKPYDVMKLHAKLYEQTVTDHGILDKTVIDGFVAFSDELSIGKVYKDKNYLGTVRFNTNAGKVVSIDVNVTFKTTFDGNLKVYDREPFPN